MTCGSKKMQQILLENPDLQDFGFGAYDSSHKTADQIADEIEDGRKRMLTSTEEFEAARNWLRQFSKTKHVCRTGTSYGLKHVAEHSIGYCTNGVFIAAAIAEGFRVVRASKGSPNAWMNITTKAWASPSGE